MSAKKQHHKKNQDQPALGKQPEAGDDLDERQRLGGMDSGKRAQADNHDTTKDHPRERTGGEANDAGQSRLNEG